ncbi:xanthine dehydrogenase YagS FAD-binding subunit [Chitinophaga skermanii]|uniref:Xanthine dehydrogenase YagS FAD-binding subunit n=1 Tax=Chitinophaga skermanii TaxID=331697 RepID=A0A327Q1V4_9BACT|nr:xanthine dehydrogenase family protein subunit M [Chitinophaga skermanii]RAI97844.1 xanthine dehydrogenase YagS FAD-binding subunit [Chitinophaga skermanii]
MRPFTFQRIQSLDQASARKANDGHQCIAGGTNLLDLMKKNITVPEVLLDITKALPDQIETTAKGIRIGAMVRNSAAANHDLIRSKFPLVSKALLAGASPQIRNMASIGGNLLQRTRCPYFYDTTLPCNKRNPGTGCGAIDGENRMSAIVGYSTECVAVHPSDLCIALAALDANVIIRTTDKKETIIPFKDFHRLPGETPEQDNNLPVSGIITAVDIPSNQFFKNAAYVKLRDRESYAFALISVAAALELNGNKIVQARLASGGVAHKPWRWYEAEAFLKGKNATLETFQKAAAIVVKETKPLSNNAFKVPMLKGAVEVALQNCLNA